MQQRRYDSINTRAMEQQGCNTNAVMTTYAITTMQYHQHRRIATTRMQEQRNDKDMTGRKGGKMHPSTKQVPNTDGNGAVTETPHKDGNCTHKINSKAQAQGNKDDGTMTQPQGNDVARQERHNNHDTDNANQDENNADKALATNAQTDNTSTNVVKEEGKKVVSIYLVLFYFIVGIRALISSRSLTSIHL
jgi:hypothetical protein